MTTGPDTARRTARALRQFLWIAVAVVGLALAAGLFFGRGEPQRAAQLLLRDRVEVEAAAPDGAVVGAPLPTSGPAGAAAPACGVVDGPLEVEEQVARLAAGIVLLQHDPDLPAREVAALHDLAEEGRRVLVAPHPAVDRGVVATAWTRRLVRTEVDAELLDTFVTAYAGGGPAPAPCP